VDLKMSSEGADLTWYRTPFQSLGPATEMPDHPLICSDTVS